MIFVMVIRTAAQNAGTRAVFGLRCLACKALVCGVVLDALLRPTCCSFGAAFGCRAVSRLAIPVVFEVT